MRPTISTRGSEAAGPSWLPGRANTSTDPEHVARCEQLLRPWVNMSLDTVIAIDPQIITDIRTVAANNQFGLTRNIWTPG